jgi:hypothetical protein
MTSSDEGPLIEELEDAPENTTQTAGVSAGNTDADYDWSGASQGLGASSSATKTGEPEGEADAGEIKFICR